MRFCPVLTSPLSKGYRKRRVESLISGKIFPQQWAPEMFSFLQDRRSALRRVGVIALGWMVIAAGWGSARAQAPAAIKPLVPVPQVVVHETASEFDLAALGPHFSEPWMRAALPTLAPRGERPALLQRVTTEDGADAFGRQTRTTHDRAADGRLLERRVERRRGASWTPARRTRLVYQEGALAAQHTEVWLDGTWHPDRQTTLRRDARDRVREIVQQTWRGGEWANDVRFTILPADTSRIRRVVRATWTENTWAPTSRVTFTVAEEGRHITQRNEVWVSGQWTRDVRITYLYDGAGYPIEKSLAVWTGQRWADGPLHFYDYDVQGQRIEQRTETWMGTRRVRVERAQLTYAAPVEVLLLGQVSFE